MRYLLAKICKSDKSVIGKMKLVFKSSGNLFAYIEMNSIQFLKERVGATSQGCHGIDEIVVSVNLSCHVTTTIPNSSTADTAEFGNSISITVKPNIEQSRDPTVPNITQYILAKSNNTDPIHSQVEQLPITLVLLGVEIKNYLGLDSVENIKASTGNSVQNGDGIQ